jgi:hypothetical protein
MKPMNRLRCAAVCLGLLFDSFDIAEVGMRELTRSLVIASCLFVGCASSDGGGGPGGSDAGVDASDGAHDSTLGQDSGVDGHADTPPSEGGGDAIDAGDSMDAPIDATGDCSDVVDVTSALGKSFHVPAGGVARADHGSCAGSSATKRYLKFTAPKKSNYRIDISGGASSFGSEAAMYIRATCSDPAAELTCNDRAAFLNTPVGIPAAGDVFFVADGDYFAPGFDIAITDIFGCTFDSDCDLFVGQTKCSDGVCTGPLVCPTGKGDCDGIAANGCETDLTTIKDCGKCGNACDGGGFFVLHATPSCVSGACATVCDAGWNDCDGDTTNGCESNPTVDPYNCGGCTKECAGGGGCAASACTTPTIASTHSYFARLLEVDDSAAYWTEWGLGSSKAAISMTGAGVKSTLGSIPDYPGDFAITSTSLVALEQASPYAIWTAPKTGGAFTPVLSSSGDSYWAITADDTNAYWPGAFLPLTGATSATTLATATTPAGLFVDATHLYWFEQGSTWSLVRIPKTTPGTVETVTSFPSTFEGTDAPDKIIAVGTKNIFYTFSGELYAVPKTGGTATKIDLLGGGGAIAVSGTSLFVANDPYSKGFPNEGVIWELDADGKVLRSVAHIDDYSLDIGELAVSSKWVAWIEAAGGTDEYVKITAR